jgi:spore coat protein H
MVMQLRSHAPAGTAKPPIRLGLPSWLGLQIVLGALGVSGGSHGQGYDLASASLVSQSNTVGALPHDRHASSAGSAVVCRIHLDLAAQDMRALRDNSRQYVPARVRVHGRIFPGQNNRTHQTYPDLGQANTSASGVPTPGFLGSSEGKSQDSDIVMHPVGIHLKGATGSFRSLDDKPSFTLDFGRFMEGGKVQGLRKIHLNNSVEDPTYIKDQLGSELCRAARIPVPQISHARVVLNGHLLGIYVVKEGYANEFFGRYFARADGELYENDALGQADLNPTSAALPGDAAKPGILRRLAAATCEPNLDRRWQSLQVLLDMDQFVRFMALEIILCHWDGYCLARNNYRMYHDPSTDKLAFLPAGMDQLFSKADMPLMPDMAGEVARAVMEVPAGRRLYTETIKTLATSHLDPDQLGQLLDELLSALRPCATKSEFRLIREETAELRMRIMQRAAFLHLYSDPPEPADLVFHNHVASLGGWQPFGASTTGQMSESSGPERLPILEIRAEPNTSASWRTTVILSRGRYRFSGSVRTRGIQPLAFGKHQGASLRVAGSSNRSSALLGTCDWQTLSVDFEVKAPSTNMVLICELRGAAGQAWYNQESLTLTRLVTLKGAGMPRSFEGLRYPVDLGPKPPRSCLGWTALEGDGADYKHDVAVMAKEV